MEETGSVNSFETALLNNRRKRKCWKSCFKCTGCNCIQVFLNLIFFSVIIGLLLNLTFQIPKIQKQTVSTTSSQTTARLTTGQKITSVKPENANTTIENTATTWTTKSSSPTLSTTTKYPLPRDKLQGLVGFWPMNDRYYLCDISGYGHPLATEVVYNPDTGREHNAVCVGKCLQFDVGPDGSVKGSLLFSGNNGTEEYRSTRVNQIQLSKTIDTPLEFKNSNSTTILAYVRNITQDGPIYSVYDYACNYLLHFWVIRKEGGLFARFYPLDPFDAQHGCKYDQPITHSLPENGDWHWVGFSFDSMTQNRRLWINNTAVAVDKSNYTNIFSITYSGVFIGQHNTDERVMKGNMACLMVFDKALDENEMKAAEQFCLQTSRGEHYRDLVEDSCKYPKQNKTVQQDCE